MDSEKPNILFLFTDQHRFDAVGCNGAAVCRTPAMDSIALQGMRFLRAYTPIALCSPARGSLLTGLYSHNHGQLANTGNFNRVFDTQILDKTGYPQLLSKAGYRMAYSGKWHLPKEGDGEFWSFDRWHTTREWQRSLKAEGIDFDYGRDEVQRLEWGPEAPFCGRSSITAGKMQEAWVADRTIDMIRSYSGSGQPFMICAAFHGPHFPYAVPEPYDQMYDPVSVSRWNASQLTWPDWQRVIAHYWGYCTFIDDQIEKVLACLEQCGIAQNTIIVYSTDHGDMLGSHRLFNKGFNMYEEDHHIPLLVNWPGVTKPGSVCDDFVNLLDLMPTFLDMAGKNIPAGLDARSLTPLLRGSRPAGWPDDVFAEFHGYEATLGTIRMVRTKRWKYVYNPHSIDELYDLQADPGELTNLAAEAACSGDLQEMKARMLGWNDATGDMFQWKWVRWNFPDPLPPTSGL